MVHANRLKLTEVPVRMFMRETGRSSITKSRSFYYMVKVSLALLAGLMRRRVVIDSGESAPVSSVHG
jgi:hypothetical protein